MVIFMKIQRLILENFKSFTHLDLNIDGKSCVFFGENGTGKSSVLNAVCFLSWGWLNRMNPAQGTAFKSLNEDLVHFGSDKMSIQGDFLLNNQYFTLKKGYTKKKPGKNAVVESNKKMYDKFIDGYLDLYDEEDQDIPIFVNYGTNRSVLDIPLRIRNKHEFDKWTALQRAIENELDFRTFFEWFRNQEDYEAELIREYGDLNHRDKSLECVRTAIENMLPDFSNLHVRRQPLRMVVTKGGEEFSVDQLSDGEKCTIALIGDLARRMALANQKRSNPLEGRGIVLIDEIELHMHPTWQRMILPVLKKTFPNIQFLITTHSPQVLGEVSDDFNIYLLSVDTDFEVQPEKINRLDGFSSDYILREFMNTDSVNPEFSKLVQQVENSVHKNQFDEAEKILDKIKEVVGNNYSQVIHLTGLIRREKIIYEKNHKK